MEGIADLLRRLEDQEITKTDTPFTIVLFTLLIVAVLIACAIFVVLFAGFLLALVGLAVIVCLVCLPILMLLFFVRLIASAVRRRTPDLKNGRPEVLSDLPPH